MSTELLSDKNVQEIRSSIVGRDSEYRDLSLKFRAHPEHGDIKVLREIEAIKNSINNIIKTRRGEKPFNPKFGCDLQSYLFEPIDGITKASIRDEINYSIVVHEPRVSVQEITVEGFPDRNAYEITIKVLLINQQRDIEFSLILERLR
jgi:phage baseplate assembly protein W